ncbi:hypothetical protein [Paenibacillus koleovorans]|uniref:hypothetical protein n=1 Tax=Paenibacillus koleovorans TaxID=121608 RepID=UPI000FDBD97E|nr:hypothetical protein [Paenibacillus koleovorans]
MIETRSAYSYFRPRRAASWWNTINDLMWPQKSVKDKIKRRAEGFAEAGIDTAINFGFHIRFDFANHFGQLHGYMNEVCEELHKYGIRFIDHYSCNLLERPRGEKEYAKLHAAQRHHVLLHPDPVAAEYAGYLGYRFHDMCQVDLRDGGRGYTTAYQGEMFCHNNPMFLEMHGKYLERLLREVELDGAEIDDMADYGWLSTCGCVHCRERFKRDYGHTLPELSDTSFWGETSGAPITWGNYDHPAFRDWIRMRTDSIADHVKHIKSYFPDKPLMTCCSSTGPIVLNAVSLNLEKMSPHLDMLMLENCGIGTGSVKWARMDAEALQQKDIALRMGGAPAMALSYMIYDKGGYLGWALSRFWGVVNWSSTLPGRLVEDPVDMKETHEIVGPYNVWEKAHSDLDGQAGADVAEVRLASSKYCRDNGWRDADGAEHWDRVLRWSGAFVNRSVGYRLVRNDELADAEALKRDRTPLVLDGVGCVSDAQFEAVRSMLEAGGEVWLCLPFGTHDERGFARPEPLSAALLRGSAGAAYPGLHLLAAGDERAAGGVAAASVAAGGNGTVDAGGDSVSEMDSAAAGVSAADSSGTGSTAAGVYAADSSGTGSAAAGVNAADSSGTGSAAAGVSAADSSGVAGTTGVSDTGDIASGHDVSPGSEAAIAAAAAQAAGGSIASAALTKLIESSAFQPRIGQLAGDASWALRLRVHAEEGVVLHVLNQALEAIPDPVHKDAHNGSVVLRDFRSLSTDNRLSYEIDLGGLDAPAWTSAAVVRSPELGAETRPAVVERLSNTKVRVSIDLTGVELYAVVSQ